MNKLSIERSIWINAHPEKVWVAITDPKEIENWFSPGLPWELDILEPGGKLVWHATKEEKELHIVEKVEYLEEFRYRWEPKPPYTPLTTSYILSEEEEGTRVTVVETGFELIPQISQKERMEGNEKGYDEALKNLKEYLEK